MAMPTWYFLSYNTHVNSSVSKASLISPDCLGQGLTESQTFECLGHTCAMDCLTSLHCQWLTPAIHCYRDYGNRLSNSDHIMWWPRAGCNSSDVVSIADSFNKLGVTVTHVQVWLVICQLMPWKENLAGYPVNMTGYPLLDVHLGARNL